jgi:hypothetical protein
VSVFLTVPTTSAESWPYLISALQNKNSAAIEKQNAAPNSSQYNTVSITSSVLVHPTTPAGPPIVSRADVGGRENRLTGGTNQRPHSTLRLFSLLTPEVGGAPCTRTRWLPLSVDWRSDQRVLIGITFRPRGLRSKLRPELHSCRRSSFLYYRPSRQRCAGRDSELEDSLHCAK